jgi:hypothetical protein
VRCVVKWLDDKGRKGRCSQLSLLFFFESDSSVRVRDFTTGKGGHFGGGDVQRFGGQESGEARMCGGYDYMNRLQMSDSVSHRAMSSSSSHKSALPVRDSAFRRFVACSTTLTASRTSAAVTPVIPSLSDRDLEGELDRRPLRQS